MWSWRLKLSHKMTGISTFNRAVPVMNNMNPLHTLTFCFFKTHFNIIMTSPFSIKVSYKLLCSPVFLTAPSLAHDLIILTKATNYEALHYTVF